MIYRVHNYTVKNAAEAGRIYQRILAAKDMVAEAFTDPAMQRSGLTGPGRIHARGDVNEPAPVLPQAKPIMDPEAGSVLDADGYVAPQPGTVPNPGAHTRPPAPDLPAPDTNSGTAEPPAPSQVPPTAPTKPGTDDPTLPPIGSLPDLLAADEGPALEPGQSRTLPSGITITANPDETTSVTRTSQQTGAIHTDVYNKHGVLISTAISTEVPGTDGTSRDTTITDSQGVTSMRSVSNGRGGFTTWTANPDGTHSVQYPDQQIIQELDGIPIEIVQLDPDGLGGHSTGINPDGSNYSSAFRMGADGITQTALSSSDGTEIGITTIPGQTNGAPISIVTRSDNSRFVLYPDGTRVPIDRYNNVIDGPNYANQFDPLTGTWRSDPYHRRGPILMNADGTSHQEWFAFDENGKESSSTAHFDTEGNITRLESLDYLGLKVTEFETKDGITTPLTTNFLDSGHVEDQSTLVLETALMFVGVPSLGGNIGRQIVNRLIASQMTRQGLSKASIALTLNHIGGPGSTAFLAAASAARRPTLTLPVTQVYAPTGMWDATIALGQKTATGIRTGIDSVNSGAAAVIQMSTSDAELTRAFFTELRVTSRTPARGSVGRASTGPTATLPPIRIDIGKASSTTTTWFKRFVETLQKTGLAAGTRSPSVPSGIESMTERAALGRHQPGVERTLDNSLDKTTYLYDVAAQYRIRLRGSGQEIRIVFDPDLAPGLLGLTRATDGGRIIRIGPAALVDDATAANTIAHEISHARYYPSKLPFLRPCGIIGGWHAIRCRKRSTELDRGIPMSADSQWFNIEEEFYKAWRDIFNNDWHSADIDDTCPKCGSHSLHRWYSLDEKLPKRIFEVDYAGIGRLWEWCSSCHSFETFSNGYVPIWWEEPYTVDKSELRYDPAPIEKVRKKTYPATSEHE